MQAEYRGKIQGGVVVFSEPVDLPDGVPVTVSVVRAAREPLVFLTDPALTTAQRIEQLGRWAETQPCDLPPDLAANHDHYLHGLPKRG